MTEKQVERLIDVLADVAATLDDINDNLALIATAIDRVVVEGDRGRWYVRILDIGRD